jgi:crotonobetainyl-CoA:carnitine CoA-transferase CaiB-like acyl-CoA transferase
MFADPAPAPTLGQHNAAVFGDLLGLTPEHVAGLSQRGVI